MSAHRRGRHGALSARPQLSAADDAAQRVAAAALRIGRATGLAKGDADPRARVPMRARLLAKEQEAPSVLLGKAQQHIIGMRIIAKDDGALRQQRLYGLILAVLILGGMVAIIDEQVNGSAQFLQRFDRVAIENLAIVAPRLVE